MTKSKQTEAQHTPTEQSELRKQLIALLRGGQAHATFDEAIKDFPAEHRGTVPPNLPYSAWQLLEHLRITQRDILHFSASHRWLSPSGVARRLLAQISRAAFRPRLGHLHCSHPQRPRTLRSPHHQARIRPLQALPLGRRPESPSRSASRRRPHRLSSR